MLYKIAIGILVATQLHSMEYMKEHIKQFWYVKTQQDFITAYDLDNKTELKELLKAVKAGALDLDMDGLKRILPDLIETDKELFEQLLNSVSPHHYEKLIQAIVDHYFYRIVYRTAQDLFDAERDERSKWLIDRDEVNQWLSRLQRFRTSPLFFAVAINNLNYFKLFLILGCNNLVNEADGKYLFNMIRSYDRYKFLHILVKST